MLPSLGQTYSLLDDEPRYNRQNVDAFNPSSSVVQKQKIVWSDSLQQDYRKRQQRQHSCTPYSNTQNLISSGRLIPRKRYIILRPDSINQNTAQPVRNTIQVNDEIVEKPIAIRAVSISSSTARQTQITRTISRAIVPRANTQYVLKIPVVRKHYDSRASLKRAVMPKPKSESTLMAMHVPTVPPNMSMGGEYIEEEEVDDDEFAWKDSLLVNNDHSFQQKESDCFDSKAQLHCPDFDCFWRGDSEAALHRHCQQVHVKTAPVISETNLKSVIKAVGKPKGVRCSECDALAYSRPLLLKHMTQIHGIEAPIMHRTFDDREELQQWLEELRSTHAVEFVVSSGSKKWGFGLQVHYLTCSRSGEQKERPNKKFARPPRPSIKCGKNCMAYLKIKQNPITSVLQVEGCLFHSGHMIDGSLLQLNASEWRKIEAVADLYERDQLAWEIDADHFNLSAVRDVLGRYGRFRLIPDQQLRSLLKQWIKEYNDQIIRHDTSFSFPSTSLKFSPGSFDINQTNMIPMLDDFDEYDSNSPASPIPCD